MSGFGLDIGYKGYVENPEPILPTAIGIDEGSHAYDGHTLPFDTESKDYVFAGHVLEHVPDPIEKIREWFRVVKVGGHLVLVLPHQYLYEKKKEPPSYHCETHLRFYTPAKLLIEIESALAPNSYRVAHLQDIDENFDYNVTPGTGMQWWVERFEIECVLRKIKKPHWELA